MVSGRIRIARKAKHRDAGDLQQAAEPIGAEGEITEFLGACLYNRDLCCKATGALLQSNRVRSHGFLGQLVRQVGFGRPV